MSTDHSIRQDDFGTCHQITRAVLAGLGYFDGNRRRPPDFPFPILGVPAWHMRGGCMYATQHALEILKAGTKLERLAWRMRALEAECRIFAALRDGWER